MRRLPVDRRRRAPKHGKDGVRVLGKGDLTAKLSFHVAGVSAGAREMIEKAGGSLTVTTAQAAE